MTTHDDLMHLEQSLGTTSDALELARERMRRSQRLRALKALTRGLELARERAERLEVSAYLREQPTLHEPAVPKPVETPHPVRARAEADYLWSYKTKLRKQRHVSYPNRPARRPLPGGELARRALLGHITRSFFERDDVYAQDEVETIFNIALYELLLETDFCHVRRYATELALWRRSLDNQLYWMA